MGVGSCTLANDPPGLTDSLIADRIAGKSWAEIATSYNLGSPSAARSKFKKLTGIDDFKIKGKDLEQLVKNMKAGIVNAGETIAKAVVKEVQEEVMDIIENGPSAFNLIDKYDAFHKQAINNLSGVDVQQLKTFINNNYTYTQIASKSNITLQQVDNRVWNYLLEKNQGDVWTAYVTKPTSEYGFNTVSNLILDMRKAGLSLNEISELTSIDSRVVHLVVEDKWTLPKAGSLKYKVEVDPYGLKTYASAPTKPVQNPWGAPSGGSASTYQAPAKSPYGSASTSGSSGGKYGYGETAKIDLGPVKASGYQPRADGDMRAWSDRLPSLSSSEKHAVQSYTGSGYGRINNSLRGIDGWSMNPDIEDYVRNIDSAFGPLDKDTLLRRNVDAVGIPELNMTNPQALVGQVISDPAFLSTTIKVDQGVFSHKRVTIFIKAPKGTPSRYVDAFSLNSGEAEVILARDTRFMVEEVIDQGSGYVQILVQLLL